MKKASIAIGVDRTGSLRPLQGAANGAERFHSWALGQGFESILLTDLNEGTVTYYDIFNEVKRIVDAMTYEQLIIFFAGHGQLTAPNCEVWLLSGAPDNPNEAVNLTGSIDLARESGIKHVVFISDACRSITDHTRRMVFGSLIFPSRYYSSSSYLDRIYATHLGHPALEAPEEKAVKEYRGLLTECLLEGLSGRDQTLVQQFKSLPSKPWVVATRPLIDYLVLEVPKAAAAIGIQYKQDPVVIVESAEPYFLAEVGAPTSPSRSVSRSPRPPDRPLDASSSHALLHVIQAYEALLSADFPAPMELSGDDTSLSEEIGFKASIDKILFTRSRVSLETRPGFSFNGSRVVRVLSSTTDGWIEPGHPDFFMENDVWHFRTKDVPWRQVTRSLLVQFEEGTGACLAILSDYVGSLLVEEGRVTNLNYVPAYGTYAFREYPEWSDEVEKRRAVIAAAARHGHFAVQPGSEGFMASYLRRFKALDPTLGLYAAYAAMQKGDVTTIRSILSYIQRGGPFGPSNEIPFDVALLAGEKRLAQSLGIAPACPMLTQGWAYLDRFADFIPAEIMRARNELVPGLWTTFTPDGVKILENAIMNKIIL